MLEVQLQRETKSQPLVLPVLPVLPALPALPALPVLLALPVLPVLLMTIPGLLLMETHNNLCLRLTLSSRLAPRATMTLPLDVMPPVLLVLLVLLVLVAHWE